MGEVLKYKPDEGQIDANDLGETTEEDKKYPKGNEALQKFAENLKKLQDAKGGSMSFGQLRLKSGLVRPEQILKLYNEIDLEKDPEEKKKLEVNLEKKYGFTSEQVSTALRGDVETKSVKIEKTAKEMGVNPKLIIQKLNRRVQPKVGGLSYEELKQKIYKTQTKEEEISEPVQVQKIPEQKPVPIAPTMLEEAKMETSKKEYQPKESAVSNFITNISDRWNTWRGKKMMETSESLDKTNYQTPQNAPLVEKQTLTSNTPIETTDDKDWQIAENSQLKQTEPKKKGLFGRMKNFLHEQ